MCLYMTQAAYRQLQFRAERLRELDAPPIIQHNEQHMLDNAVPVQPDADGWHHFPCRGRGQTNSFVGEDCGYRLLLPGDSYLSIHDLEQALRLTRQLAAGVGFALLNEDVFFLVPRHALGRTADDLLRVVMDGLHALRGQGSLTALLLPNGETLFRWGPLLYCAASAHPADEGVSREELDAAAGHLRYVCEMADIQLLAVPEDYADAVSADGRCYVPDWVNADELCPDEADDCGEDEPGWGWDEDDGGWDEVDRDEG